MNDMEAMRDADRRRREAMVGGDVEELGRLLADELVWTHSSGRRDDKRGLLERIAGRAAVYRVLEVEDDAVSRHGEIFVHHGTLTGRVSVDGAEKALRNRFLSVWRRSGGAFELLAWQSTGF